MAPRRTHDRGLGVHEPRGDPRGGRASPSTPSASRVLAQDANPHRAAPSPALTRKNRCGRRVALTEPHLSNRKVGKGAKPRSSAPSHATKTQHRAPTSRLLRWATRSHSGSKNARTAPLFCCAPLGPPYWATALYKISKSPPTVWGVPASFLSGAGMFFLYSSAFSASDRGPLISPDLRPAFSDITSSTAFPLGDRKRHCMFSRENLDRGAFLVAPVRRAAAQ